MKLLLGYVTKCVNQWLAIVVAAVPKEISKNLSLSKSLHYPSTNLSMHNYLIET
jgi:hypothetical protein